MDGSALDTSSDDSAAMSAFQQRVSLPRQPAQGRHAEIERFRVWLSAEMNRMRSELDAILALRDAG
jgi:hypothetical protein